MRLDEARGRRGVGAPLRPARPAGAPRQTPERTPGAPERTVWRSKRAGVLSSAKLAALRFVRNGWLLALIALGVLVADTLICVVPLYNSLVTDIQLQTSLSATDPAAHNVEAQLVSGEVSSSASASTNTSVTTFGRQYLASFTSSATSYFIVGDAFLLSQAGDHTYAPTASRPPQAAAEAFDYSKAAPHMRLLSGRLPQTAASGATPEVIVTQEMADNQGLAVGSTLMLAQFGAHGNQFHARVVGVWMPRTVNDPYWNSFSFSTSNPGGLPKPFPILMTFSTLFSGFSAFAGAGMTQHVVYYTVQSRISSANMGDVANDIALFRAHVDGALLGSNGITTANVNTQLDQFIANVQGQQSLLALPLYIVVAQIVGLALLFVAAMAGLLIERQAGEIATLKSRGASGAQILGIFLTQGAAVGVIAALLSPFIAAVIGVTLTRAFVPASVFQRLGVGSAYFTQLASPQSVALPALAGALLGVIVICLSAWQAARLDVLAFRREQGRAARQPFWQRYYLDLGLVALCAVGYLELGQFGSASVRLQLGGASNLLLLLSPALLLLAGALLVLRLAPLGATLGERVATRGRGLIAMLSLAQVERTPSRYSRIILLLVLAVGLGIFALSFNSSLTQNTYDRAAYDVGANLRLKQFAPEPPGYGDVLAKTYLKLPNVTAVAPVYRTIAQTSPDQGGVSLNLLAVDPNTFASVANGVSWRADYASQSLTALMQTMRAHQANSSAAGTASAPNWTAVSQTFAAQYQLSVGQRFTLQLSDGTGGSATFIVGAIVNNFPTLYPQDYPSGFVVVSLTDFENTIGVLSPNTNVTIGPDEYWLRTTGGASQEAQTVAALQAHPEYSIDNVISLRQELATAQENPVNAGLRGLLLLGAVMAAALAIVGSAVQTLLAVRQRATQFAVLRTLGLSNRELASILLGEQLVVYLFGLLGGAILGALLTTATLPYLQFSDPTLNPARLGVPPYTLVIDWPNVAIFFAALLVACGLALALAARVAVSQGLGQALRIGED
ncbi:MAG TPA: FtsX-like permease family protein [Ktedonobacterales bacterium]|nr:FtsX-like permease family protein [Ktedonobacterales bacterium]